MIELNGIELPSSLEWVDEFSWSPVNQEIDFAVSGALIITESTQLSGRPITLSGTSESAWAKRSVIEQLKILAYAADATYLLNYRGTAYSVRFDHSKGAPIEARSIGGIVNTTADDYYTLKLKLIEV